MAHVITGIDVGSYAVKFVSVETGFRKAKIQAAFEQLVPAGPEPLEERQGKALAAGIAVALAPAAPPTPPMNVET